MNTPKKMAALLRTDATTTPSCNDTKDKPRTKIHSILNVFLGGVSLNRFEAQNHHDHCLHSTVSSLQNEWGIVIDRRMEKVPCLGGTSTVRVMRYWLDTKPDNLSAARVMRVFWAGA